MVVLVVTWYALPGHEEEVATLFSKLAVEARKEPGCLMFNPHQHKINPGRFLIYEQYKDEAAFEAHRASPHFKDYVQKQLPRVGVRVEGEFFQEAS